MRVVISASTHRAFSDGLMPLARLRLQPLDAVNDNDVQSRHPKSTVAFHTRRAAYGQTELIITLLVLVAGIVAMPLLQGVAMPITNASEQRPEVLRGSPIAPTLLPPQGNG
jgi:hypothetical protein